MSAPLVVACSHCSAQLKLKDNSMIGKKVRCPKCEEPFLIQVPRPSHPQENSIDEGDFYDDPEDEWTDEFGDLGTDFEDHNEEFDSPSRSGKKKTSKRGSKQKGKKKKKSKSGFPLLLIAAFAGGGVLLLSLVGVAVYLVVPLLGGGANRLLWLPNDTQTYVEIRVAKVWNSDVLKILRTSEIGAEIKKQLSETGNLAIDDIEKIVVGVPASGEQPIVIIHARKAIDPEKLGPGTTKSTYAGRTLYQRATGDTVGFLVNSQTLVAGRKAQIESAIDRNGECAVADQFTKIPASGDIIFASLSPSTSMRNSPLRMLGSTPLVANKLKALQGYCNLARDIDLRVTMNFENEASAQAALSSAQQNLTTSKEQLDKTQQQLEGGDSTHFLMNRQQKAMVLKMKEVMNSVRFSGSGDDMTTSAKIPGATVETFFESFGGMAKGMMLPGGGDIPLIQQ